MEIIAIKNLTFSYKNKQIFNNLNLIIEENSFVTILGNNGSGKSTLAKILVGLLQANGYIKIGDYVLTLDNIKQIRKNIGIVFENPDNQFIAETVMDDIAFTLENMEIDKKEIRNKVATIASYLGITDILESNPHSLSMGQKQLVALASALVHEPKILILDEALTMLDSNYKLKINEILKQLKTDKKLTIINITHDIEDTLLGDKIVLINNGTVILNENTLEAFKNEKVFTDLGFSLPFMIELSNRLMFYDLINQPILDMEKMVDELWK